MDDRTQDQSVDTDGDTAEEEQTEEKEETEPDE